MWRTVVTMEQVLFYLTLIVLAVPRWTSGEVSGGMLFPRVSESRQIHELDGMWNFRADKSPGRRAGLDEQWFKTPLDQSGPVITMPICSSFNDITTDRSLQYFSGWVWYDKEFYVDSAWQQKRVVLRVESAHYNAIVWVNGVEVMNHTGGHLPFEVAVNKYVTFSGLNRVTIAINNTLTPHTLPTGSIQWKDGKGYPPGYFVQNLQFDFFNYAGLHRKVRLYTTPQNYIDDITILTTDFSGTTAFVDYTILTVSSVVDPESQNRVDSERLYFQRSTHDDNVLVEIIDRNETVVASGSGTVGRLNIENPNLWWPYTMSKDSYGYLYRLKVTYGTDVYRQPFGVRTINVNSQHLLINSKPFYCLGVAKHEDSDIRGKGLDFPLIARDFNMLKWLGANCFRTSHYPYAEEILEMADQQGIVVIDEGTAVGLQTDENFSNQTLSHHLQVMEELVRRDKNHPAVIMWSVANEPSSSKPVAEQYFKTVISHTRSLDPTRLVVFVISESFDTDRAAQFVDVLCINRYYGWYEDTGHLDTIPYKLTQDLDNWYKRFQRPIIITEYGADTVPGLHTMPTFIFTEDYQVDFLKEYHGVFDNFRRSYLTGEMVWNFADFMTDETVLRVVGNKKGVLTRQRQPKAGGHLLRHRYWSIINETMPFPVIPY